MASQGRIRAQQQFLSARLQFPADEPRLKTKIDVVALVHVYPLDADGWLAHELAGFVDWSLDPRFLAVEVLRFFCSGFDDELLLQQLTSRCVESPSCDAPVERQEQILPRLLVTFVLGRTDYTPGISLSC